MSDRPETKFARKHPSGTTSDPAVTKALVSAVKEGKVSCQAAHRIADKLNVSPGAVGVAIDLLDYRLSKCQLGLFGYSPRKKIVVPAADIDPAVEKMVLEQVRDRCLECATAWQIADKLGIPRIAVANQCERMDIKITHCPLGAF